MASFTEQINEQFLCPITHEIMKDPVIGSDGQTYERSAITEWLKHNHVSPVTRQHMQNKDLIPNIALRNTIEQFLQLQGKQQQQATSSSSSSQKPPSAALPTYNHNITLELDAVPISNNNEKEEEEALIHISAIPDDELKRKPCVVICILDVSGSMQTEATENSKEGESGFSRLDLVKHSMKTVVNILDTQDHLAIVPFSTSARVQLPLTLMSETGKKRANKEIDGLEVDSQTNIWDGLRVAMDLTKNPICKDQNVVLLLLTDGEPNVDPPRGLIPTLKKYATENPLTCTIHTFGFGYQLDSQLLNDISNVGSGTYAYIPDCTMVGTVFVNFLSNALSMMANRAHLSITPSTGVKIVEAVGFEGTSSELSLGSIQYGQSRDVILKVSVPQGHTGAILTASLKYGEHDVKSSLESIHATKNQVEVYYHYSRLLVIERVKKAMADFKLNATLEDCLKLIEATMKELSSFPSKQDSRVQALLVDLKSSKEHEGGQVCKAFSKAEWYTKWGQHYIPSLLRAHSQQQCNNFKDPGVQIYGGKLFAELRERADSIFCKLPPPKPSSGAEEVARQLASMGYAVPQHAAPVQRSRTTNMSAWYNSSGSCFTAEGIVSLDKNATKRVDQIRKGDLVKSGEATAEVVCVIKTKVATPTTRLVDLNGVRITPYHPVRVEGTWKFPQDIKQPTHQACDFVYNLVLDKMHIVTINGWECVTLGHGFNDNQVVAHEYFGTERVIHDMKQMQGWEAGYIELNEADISRHPETGRVTSFIQQQQHP